MYTIDDLYNAIPEHRKENLPSQEELNDLYEEYKDVLPGVVVGALAFLMARDFDIAMLAQTLFLEGVRTERERQRGANSD